ncbi:hypothetical protein BGZ72_009334 [Mortierella alpina]|nr:hypothetical protein BGZ72_009334 [Mortierella alpina]
MGNVSSADHDKVNEPLTRRARKKIGVIGDRKQTKQHDRLSAGYSTSPGQSASPQEATLSPLSSRQRSPPVSVNGAKPEFTDDVNQHNRPLSQAEFYAKSLADCSPLTPASPTTSFSIPSSAATAAPNSPTHDPYSVLFTPASSTQDPSTLKPSLPITIPAMAPPGHLRQQQHESTVPPLTLNIEDHTHYRQQQLNLSADLRHLGTSPEAKDWLKQKPTRSSAHMIHQYNFHSHQYYQTPGSTKVVNNVCRNLSGYAQVQTLPRINTSTSPISGTDANASEVSVLTSAASKPRPTSITAAATAIASAELSIGQEDAPQRPPAEALEKEEILASGWASSPYTASSIFLIAH